MARVKIRKPEEMSEEQRGVYNETVAGRRGRVPAPLVAWLESPVLADRAQKLGEFVRYETSLPPRLSEMAILTVARYWTAQFEWTAHKAEALKAGLDPEIIDDIAQRRVPRFKNADEPVIYDFSVALLQEHAVEDELYKRAVEKFGQRGVVELVGILGYYTLISMTLNTFEIQPEGSVPELQA
ncbi:MAG TPA: carboxymuconolactone decarboxylase family protein [Candidatus Acidoferrales bacterium]|jgi:4-carboxymuconolactone decarboxylase|nr:carboxymuconolactone decarboxylase family protein [Candidatus Acidoferrales bacterium]